MDSTGKTFRLALTGDFLDETGASAYGDIRLDLLDAKPRIEYRFLRDQQPTAGDPSYWSRFYSLQIEPQHLEGIDGLIIVRPWVKPSTFANGAETLTVIGRSGAGYDKIDVTACTANDVALFNAPLDNRPAWLWGMGGGLAGGIVGWLAWRLGTSGLPVVARALLAALVVGGGFFLIWFVAGRAWVLDFTVRPQ